MLTAISVSELNNKIKALLESTFVSVAVRGEVSRVTYHGSGHLYFTLKDSSSSVSCVMFRGNSKNLKFRLEEGMGVTVYGAITLYAPRGSYQINCQNIEPEGSGALAVAYEQLKKKLEAKGYFDKSIKKPLPKFPKKIAVVTSKTSAALQDMLRVAKKRWPLVKIVLVDTLVQGEGASLSIASAVNRADGSDADIIVVSRGGGSVEDLWAFNEEVVADAIYKARTPVVSAVGHEIDFLISDFVADLRAPTPSAAFEMILPDINEMYIYIDGLMENLNTLLKRVLAKKETTVEHLFNLYKQNSTVSKIDLYEKEIRNIRKRIDEVFSFILIKKEEEIKRGFESLKRQTEHLIYVKKRDVEFLLKNFLSADPAKRLKAGYAQVVKDQKAVRLEDIDEGERFELVSSEVKITAEAISKKYLNG